MRRPPPTYADLPSGLRLHYRIHGGAGKPWLVLINGLLADLTMWAGVVPELARHFRVLTFDSRGQGRSDAPLEGPYPTAQLAEDAHDLFRVLGVERPWLVGLSNGAAISLELLTTWPDAFTGAVLTSSLPRIDFCMALKTQHWADALELGGPLMLFDATVPFLWGETFLEARYAVLRAYHQVVTGGATSLHGNLHQIRGILDWDIRDRLQRVQVPVLLLAGAEDLLTPPWKCVETAQGIAGAQFEIVPGVGHAFPVEDPGRFVQRLLAFVAGAPV
jgi:3-oxoadipate enol-lactonase